MVKHTHIQTIYKINTLSGLKGWLLLAHSAHLYFLVHVLFSSDTAILPFLFEAFLYVDVNSVSSDCSLRLTLAADSRLVYASHSLQPPVHSISSSFSVQAPQSELLHHADVAKHH